MLFLTKLSKDSLKRDSIPTSTFILELGDQSSLRYTLSTSIYTHAYEENWLWRTTFFPQVFFPYGP